MGYTARTVEFLRHRVEDLAKSLERAKAGGDDAAAAYIGRILKESKRAYQRARPFTWNNAPVCTPGGIEVLSKDGSYPSGHAATGWAWALVLAELLPDNADAILQRGHAYGQSRVVCNVHWQSDVDQGRIAGAAVVASLHGNGEFRMQLDAVREELGGATRMNPGPDGRCTEKSASSGADQASH